MAKPKRQITPEDEITFNLLDAHTVDRLRRTGDIKLPKRTLDVPKDEKWNTKQMLSRLLQGILNGDSIPKIADRLMDIIGNNEVSAIRNARTMVTGAENVGRLDSYKDLADKGVVQRKIWIATLDDRTRESHAEIDGEEVEIDKAFSNGLMYPGDTDPSVDPSEVWNCRCSMRDHIVGFRRADGSISYVAGEEPKDQEEQVQQNDVLLSEYKALSYGDIQSRLVEESKATEFYSLMSEYSTGIYASTWKNYVEGTANPELIEKLDQLLLSSAPTSERQEEKNVIEESKSIETILTDHSEVESINGIHGQDISETWEWNEDKYDFAIDDIIDTQGFNGLPTVVSADEFDRYVNDSNIVLQRVYSGQSQDIVNAYKEELYHGDFYVDCSNGGSAHGQGMYTFSSYNGEITEDMTNGINVIIQTNEDRSGYQDHMVETMTLSSDAKIITDSDLIDLYYDDISKYAEENNISEERVEEIFEKKFENTSDYNDMTFDFGIFASAKGYDAVHITEADFTLVLNRTMLIIKGD